MLSNTNLAPSILLSFSKGDAKASWAARTARSSPSASAMPMMATPLRVITVRHILEVNVDLTGLGNDLGDTTCPVVNTLSACSKALSNDKFPKRSRNRSLLITNKVSTALRISSIPIAACCLRRRPSHWKGTCNDTNGKDAHFARDLSDNGSGTGSGTTTHTRGDEDHLRTLAEHSLISSIFSRPHPTAFRYCTSTEAFGEVHTELEFHRHRAHIKRLAIGVTNDEVHAGIPCVYMWLTALLPPPPTPITLMMEPSSFGRSNFMTWGGFFGV
jgi:hypothetical protein